MNALNKGPALRADHDRRVLNVGSGPKADGKLHPAFHRQSWQEIRLDIDPKVRPDIIGSMVQLSQIADRSLDAIWSSHNIEHLHAHEVGPALREWIRILTPDGFALVTCPDLEAIAALVLQGDLEKPAYVSPAGPITPLDMLFGHSRSIEAGNVFMAHNTGFTAVRLAGVLLDAGFAQVRVARGAHFDIWALATRVETDMRGVEQLFRGTDQEQLFQAAPARLER